MENKLTQWDLCVLYLIERGGQVRVCEMKGIQTKRGWLGSESDKRMYEVMDDIEKNGFYELEGMRYIIEPSKVGKYKTYKITDTKPKPKQTVDFIIKDGIRYARVRYA